MASTTPTEDKPAPMTAIKPAAAVSAAPGADQLPAAAPGDTVETVVEKVVASVAKPVAAAVSKPRPASVSAPIAATAATPPAKKKAVAKTIPKTVKTKIVAIVKPAIAQAKAIVPKEDIIMEAQIKNAAEKAKSLFTDANAKGTKAFGEVNDFAKGNIEALVESGKIAAKGLESIGQDTAEFTRKQFEGATAALKTLSTVKSPTDFFKLQGDYMRSYFDSLVAHSSQSTEKMLKLAGDVAQPIQNRVSVAVEKVKIAA